MKGTIIPLFAAALSVAVIAGRAGADEAKGTKIQRVTLRGVKVTTPECVGDAVETINMNGNAGGVNATFTVPPGQRMS